MAHDHGVYAFGATMLELKEQLLPLQVAPFVGVRWQTHAPGHRGRWWSHGGVPTCSRRRLAAAASRQQRSCRGRSSAVATEAHAGSSQRLCSVFWRKKVSGDFPTR
jgi:hypothetical protein